ncbi:MAG: MBL fold metallo-hydrolase [Planctomycetota bacterium]
MPGFCVLGSGSSGNCSAIRAPDPSPAAPPGRFHLVLIDLGLGPRTLAKRLEHAGTTLAEVGAVCVTHFDHDHFRPHWPNLLADLGVAVHCHRWHAPKLAKMPGGDRLASLGLIRTFDDKPFHPLAELPGLRAVPIACQHDRQGVSAFRFDLAPPASRPSQRLRLGYATDLGHVPPALLDAFTQGPPLDLLAIEANYDVRMTMNSPRPSFVNRRNLSDSGHLSNQQSFDAVRAVLDRAAAGPHRVVLLHRSQQCNHPVKLRRVFHEEPRLRRRVVLAEPRTRTAWLRAGARTTPPQPGLFTRAVHAQTGRAEPTHAIR